jgi:hypothetical protein
LGVGLVSRRSAFLAARHILRVAGLIFCLGVSAFSTGINAQSPAPHPEAPASAVQTIDAAGLSNVVDLNGPWRFHAGDDPRFADPAFDDSAWSTIHLSRTSTSDRQVLLWNAYGYVWARIHLHVPANAGRLALALYLRNGTQYTLFVNGSPLSSTPGMATRTRRFSSPSPVALPATWDMVLAIRFYCGFPLRGFPLSRASIGFLGSIQKITELDHLHYLLDSGILAILPWVCANLLFAITALVLYRSQRDHDEYLWLGIGYLFASVFSLSEIGVRSGWLPYAFLWVLTYDYAGWLTNLALIEFVVRFSRTRRLWPVRIVQGAQLIPPLLWMVTSNPTVGGLALIVGLGLFLAVAPICLISAYRRGQAESGLLLIPTVACVLLDIAWAAALVFPGRVPWGTEFRFGPIGISGNYVGEVLFCLGIFGVVLYRFMRVTRDQARAAAELEAARIVQQILVPEEIPTIPGFFIDAVYQPAGQVGGDFYQVLPTPNGGLLAVIGDVSGKGMPAAMTVSLLVGTVRTLAHYTHDPADILTAMNQRMIGRGNGGFTTALVLRLDPDGTLTAANAGHIAPYANGKELAIDNGLPLGIIADAAYSNSTLHLEANTTLTLLTDGVIEAQNAKGELFGFDRAAEISSKSAEKVAEAARTFGQEDDITVLSLALVAAG